jgi:pSer/pThr/pTyr-binding forkhead associated (FHA) protein
MYRLIFLNGKMKGRRVVVKEGSIVIGRDPSCHLHITDDAEVATRHVTIEERGGSHFLCGFHDGDRLLLNGQPVADAALKNGDTFEVGRTLIEFQVMIEQAPAGTGRRLSVLQVMALAAVVLITLAEV